MSPASLQEKPQGHSIASPHGTDPSRPTLLTLTQPLMALLLLALLATAIYSNTFSSPFQFDDIMNIVENSWIRHLYNYYDFSGSRYVGFLTFALNYHFNGLSLFGYHLVNLLIHITNGFLVYTLVRLLFRAVHSPIVNRDPVSIHSSQLVAIVTALLFVAHPIQTQAVTYIVQRLTSLAAMFYLLTVVCYLKWRLSQLNTQNKKVKTLFWYAGALLATILAMKTKEITFTLPFMLLLIEAVFFAPLIRRSWISLIPFLILPIIPLSRPGAMGEGEAGFASDITDISRWDYLLTQFRVIVTYLRLLIFPANQNLDYDYPVSHSLFDPPVFFSFLFLSALFALAIYLLLSSPLVPNFNGAPPSRPGSNPPAQRRLPYAASRLVGFGILWFFLTLSVESSIIPIRDVIYEHRLYLPSVGFWLAAGTAALGFSDRWRIPRIIAVGLIIVLFAGLTYQRNKVWQDEVTLWTDVVRKSPQKARGYNNLGSAYKKLGQYEDAIREYQTALTLKPDYAMAHYNIGIIYKELGQLDNAIRKYQTAVTLKPDYPEAQNNLGVVYKEMGRLDEALKEYNSALTLKPDYAEAHINRGNVYQALGRREEAIREFQAALTLKPDSPEAHNNLGIVYKDLGRLDEALKEYNTASTLKPDYADPHNNMGNVYQELGRLDKAIQEYKKAVKLKPDSAETYNNMGNAHSMLRHFKEAVHEYEKASVLSPDYADPHYNLGNVLRALGRMDEAIKEYQAAIARKPDYALAHNNLGLSYYLQGRPTEAIAELEKTTQLEPDFAEAHNNLGTLYTDQARLKDAIREFQIALNLKPDSVHAYYGLGNAYQRLGQTHEAFQAYEQALKINPGYERARQALGSLTQSKGRPFSQ
jgi:protein O-mannosyl-transferase